MLYNTVSYHVLYNIQLYSTPTRYIATPLLLYHELQAKNYISPVGPGAILHDLLARFQIKSQLPVRPAWVSVGVGWGGRSESGSSLRIEVTIGIQTPAPPAAPMAPSPRVRILVIVGSVHFLQKGILNHIKKRWERPTPSTLTRL